ncbi:MAG TPA: type IVB secretion system protein IcmX [Legionella sp.]|nr:type IVB secretion system protein IcmX [Legionella sp.]
MRFLSRFALVNILCLSISPAIADPLLGESSTNQNNSSSNQDLVEYLQNLGSYLGYDLTQNPTETGTVSQELLNLPITSLAENFVFSTFFGAIPVAILSGNTQFQFLPNSAAGASTINNMANATYNLQNFSTPGGQQSATVTVSPLIDQQQYQQDPVSQAVLNILGTPDSSYCTNPDGSFQNPCNPPSFPNAVISQSQVMANVIGPLPSPALQFLTYNYNQQLIGQLNSNSLLAPLFFTTNNAQSTTGSANPNAQNPGLTAQNQAQQAANFIRYVSGSVSPTPLPKQSDYQNLFLQALPPSGTKVDPAKQAQAQTALTNYFTSLRIYAAQSSVGLGNLYYILSRRLPQTPSGDGNATSQALSEFNMATWRLFNPKAGDSGGTGTASKQWVDGINAASPATVQKEIAVLLAEINYQMYLDRQIQERILFTNSVMLMQNTKAAQPTADFTNQPDTPQN